MRQRIQEGRGGTYSRGHLNEGSIMEYFLIERDKNGETGSYIVYRGANLADMSQINQLTDMIVSAIINLGESAPWLSVSREDTIKDKDLSGFGARFYVNHDVYNLVSRRFQELVRDKVAVVRRTLDGVAQ